MCPKVLLETTQQVICGSCVLWLQAHDLMIQAPPPSALSSKSILIEKTELNVFIYIIYLYEMTSFRGINQFSTSVPSIRDRLNERINIDGTTECWNWTGTKNRDGYGVLWTGGKKENGGQFKKASRLSYQEYHPLTTDISNINLFVCHKCIGNRACINPDHLYLGTPQDNMNDRREQGRENAANGEKLSSKLTEKDVLEIRKLYAGGGYTYRKLGEIYNVSESCIGGIIIRKNWKHI